MPLARIRTSDPEVVEFLSRHLASSGYQLEFVRPGEPVHGSADLEIDASRMDLDSAMAAAQQEGGLVTVLRGVLQPEPPRDIFEEAAQTPASQDYAEVSAYARGAELEDQPSALHRAAETVVGAIATGMNSVGSATKSATARFGAWKTQRDAERAARREQREREMAVEAARRREEEARFAEEETRLRAEEQHRRSEEERVAAMRREEQARADAEASQRRAEEERRRTEEVAATGIERQQQEEMHRADAPRWYQGEPVHSSEEVHHEEVAARAESLGKPTGVTAGDVPVEPMWHEAKPPQPTWDKSVAPGITYRERRRRLRRPAGERERIFKRSAVAAAIVAAGVISLWSVSAIRRPANPLSREQLMRSAAVEQMRPFGPASTKAPLALPARQPPVRRVAPARKPSQAKPTPRARSSKSHGTKSQTAKRISSDDDGKDEVVVHHFAAQRQEQAKVKMKNGVKIISEAE